MKGNYYRLSAAFVVTMLLLIGLTACKEEKSDEGGDVSGVQVASPVPNTPQQVITVVVTRTPTPMVTPSLTPTLNFPAYRVAGTWYLYIRFDLNNTAIVQQLGYSANATLEVTDYGVVTGSGMLMPVPFDPACEIRSLDAEGLSFTMEGSLRPDGERILMDVAIIPTNYSAAENYEVRCPDFNGEFRTITQPNLLWPVLSQTERMNYTFDLTQASYTVTFTEDIAARTGDVIKGLLSAELISLQ